MAQKRNLKKLVIAGNTYLNTRKIRPAKRWQFYHPAKRLHMKYQSASSLLLLTLVLILGGCFAPGLTTDLIAKKALENKPGDITRAVEYSLELTYGTDIRFFESANIKDSLMRSRVQSIGKEVLVNYESGSGTEQFPDSVVVFCTPTGMGNIQVIYDFASRQRNMASLMKSKYGYGATRVSERTYYRRGPLNY